MNYFGIIIWLVTVTMLTAAFRKGFREG